jgi:PAS domain-containing protein
VDVLHTCDETTFASAIFEMSSEPMLALDRDLIVQMVNEAFLNAFGYSRTEVVGSYLRELGRCEWSMPEVKWLLETTGYCSVRHGRQGVVLPREGSIECQRCEHKLMGIGRRMLLVSRIERLSLILLGIRQTTCNTLQQSPRVEANLEREMLALRRHS